MPPVGCELLRCQLAVTRTRYRPWLCHGPHWPAFVSLSVSPVTRPLCRSKCCSLLRQRAVVRISDRWRETSPSAPSQARHVLSSYRSSHSNLACLRPSFLLNKPADRLRGLPFSSALAAGGNANTLGEHAIDVRYAATDRGANFLNSADASAVMRLIRSPAFGRS
jgi:hypothetical protein